MAAAQNNIIEMAQSASRNIKIICRSGASIQREVLTARPPDKKQSKNFQKDSESFFTGKLDYRDEVIHVPISFTIDKATYLNNPSYYQQQLLQWLVVVVQNIFSITFRYLLQQKLGILEAKAYACKNILLNIKEMCEYLSTDIGASIDDVFLKRLDSNLSEIISTVINKYPQTNAKPASKKVMKFIKQISNRDNDQFDFLFNHNLNIKYKVNGDYSSEIMAVINKILNLPIQQIKQDESLFQNFKKFCRQLFYFSREQYNQKNQENTVQIVDESIDALLSTGKNAPRSYEILQDRQIGLHKSDFFKDMAGSLITQDYQISEDLLVFQRNKKYLFGINQKIPSEVKQFSEKQYKQGQFKIYHSSILRVLTKWSQQLYQKLQKADDNIRSRIHKFKNNSETLRFCSVQQKEQLYATALKQKCRIDDYLQNLKDQNKILQSSFAIQNLSGKYIKKFTNVNLFAGKLQQMVCHYTFRYLNRLIHSLLSIPIASGEKLYQKYKILQDKQYLADQILKQLSDINLVTFKVGDLLRAKYSCQQHEFTNILCLLYKIQQMQPNFLKIVKIKNRMFEKDNDILINFYFRNRSICELQLSIHKEQNKKQKLYSEFNHFIYELKRSEFGIISQISSIIAQHDPIVNYFTFFRHKPPAVIQKSKKHISHVNSKSKSLIFRRTISDGVFLNHKLYQKTIQRPFICQNCKNLKTVLNPKFYYRQDDQSYCNDCIQRLMYEKPNFAKNIIKDLFKYYILDEKLDQFTEKIYLWNYAQTLSNIRSEKQLYVDFIDYGFVIEKQDKIPKVKFFKTFFNYMKNSVVLSTITNGEIDNFLSLNSSKQKDRYQFYNSLQKYLFFGLKTNSQTEMISIAKNCISQQNCQQDCIKTINLKQKEFLMKEYIKTILNSFQKYHTTLYLNGYRYIMQCMFEYLHDSNEIKSAKRISLFEENASRITSILLQSSDIFSLYPFITYFTNTREINLSNNHIKSIQILQNFKKLQTLNISNNHISSIQCLNKMTWIEILIASQNEISQLNGISQIVSLKVGNFNQNRLSHIRDLDGLYNLQELDASKNNIIEMKGIQNLKALSILNLSQNNIPKIQYLDNLTSLTNIDIANNFITQMVNFAQLHKLNILNLANNSINSILKIQTTSIKDLNLSTNVIKQIDYLDHLLELNSLNLAKNDIHKIQNLQQLQKLKILILNDNQISSLQDNQLPKFLQYLTLENNPICQIQNINFLRNMSSLSFQHCQLIKIQEISKLKKLKSLSLSFNQITQIKQIDELVRLQKLDISNNKIQKIQNLNTLKYLQNLSLASNFITKIQNLQQLLQLNWLVLTKNKIAKIEGLQNLTQLKCLQLQQNEIEQISGLDYLEQLQQLMLASNKITKIYNLNSLTNLKKLSLGGNQITAICGLSKLINLQLLDLQMNQIAKIENLNTLLQLKWLILSNNQIGKIQNLERLEQLSKLFLSKNKIGKIENLSQLKVLTVLYMDFNFIEKIQGFQQMPNLEKLNLSNNRISLIEGLEKLQQLNQLNLQSNLVTIIENMQSLQKLKRLNLAHNKITSVDNLHNLKQLTYLQISANSIQSISNIHNLPYLQFINLSDNPVNNNLQTYNRLNQHVKLCIQLIMQKFDSQTLRRTIHKKVASDIKDNKEIKQLGNRVKMIKSFAKSFSPQF